ncbi:MAG: class I SAM-dependent methyltransferase [Casimicrobiaceae bacterium]
MSAFDGVLQRSRSYLSRRFGRRVAAESLIVDRLVAEPWFIDLVQVEAAQVSADGWSFPHSQATSFYLNGTPFDSISHPLLRTDVGEHFWQRREASMSGFHCRSSAVAQAYPDGIMRLSRSGDNTRIDSGRDHWYIPDASMQHDLPDADRRFRVMGNPDVTAFLNTGATDLHRLNDIVQKLLGKPLWDVARVLDWGVGCGRLARHFPRQRAGKLDGCDIDHDNVAWCAANLAGNFVPSSLAPPLPFDDDCFDVVYGVSVFTHLREALQDRWLAELRRITRVGGLVLTTVHGETAVEFFRLRPTEYAHLKLAIAKRGLLVSSGNSQLDGHVEQPGEYVNVFHDSNYIGRHWSAYFDILHVIPGYIFTHDLVVMRRRT